MINNEISPIIQVWDSPLFRQWQVIVNVLRLDQLGGNISGNKLYKLYPNLQAAKWTGQGAILSFGGMWSNHLHALAYAGQQYGFNTIGVVRGHAGQTTAMLEDVKAWGMQLHLVGPAEYRAKTSPEFIQQLHQQFGDFYLIPEGGANAKGVGGCHLIAEQIVQLSENKFDAVVLPVGTGTTAAGIACGLPEDKTVIGVSVLKGAYDLGSDIERYISNSNAASCRVEHDYHCGGYGKVNAELAEFVAEFNANNSYAIEPIYSGKAFLALTKMVAAGCFQQGARIVLIHTGGMQGARGTGQRCMRLLASAKPV